MHVAYEKIMFHLLWKKEDTEKIKVGDLKICGCVYDQHLVRAENVHSGHFTLLPVTQSL